MNQVKNERFTQVLRSAIQESVALGYTPNEFRKMLERDGGFETVKKIVPKKQPSLGFYRLYELKRIDLTCEAIIVESSWRQFFDGDLLAIAEHRLRDFGYAYKPYSESGAMVSEDETTRPADREEKDFAPPLDDHRELELRSTAKRPGQGKFRDALFLRYGESCCITRCSIRDALEAAHITAYRGEQSNHAQNGLLLRADLHTLFDRYLFGIEPETLRIFLSDALKADVAYKIYNGLVLFPDCVATPSQRALRIHWDVFAYESGGGGIVSTTASEQNGVRFTFPPNAARSRK